jgi:hypothetical protein
MTPCSSRYAESVPAYGECTDTFEDKPCGDEVCKQCVIEGVTYPINEVIPALSKPCEEQWYAENVPDLQPFQRHHHETTG